MGALSLQAKALTAVRATLALKGLFHIALPSFLWAILATLVQGVQQGPRLGFAVAILLGFPTVSCNAPILSSADPICKISRQKTNPVWATLNVISVAFANYQFDYVLNVDQL